LAGLALKSIFAAVGEAFSNIMILIDTSFSGWEPLAHSLSFAGSRQDALSPYSSKPLRHFLGLAKRRFSIGRGLLLSTMA
jgi:hypothetical protein